MIIESPQALHTLLSQGPQKVFDFVANHLMEQGCPAHDTTDQCLYRTHDDKACAFGCLIPELDYRESMEGLGLPSAMAHSDGNIGKNALDMFLTRYEFGPYASLLQRLQSIHDAYLVDVWPRELAECAKENNLVYTGQKS